jgi:3-methylcrotonyl-CoA carboxylase alpha subunit
MFDKILIANRGEIACRVARTARRMGVHTVAVYSDADANALHVALCDEAHRLGPPVPRESYLNVDALLAVARASGAQAIHPGYGFLSENEDFAAAVAAAGLVFIGPPPAAIRSMGSKAEAKALMAKAGVPVVPGYHGADQAPLTLAREARAIGYPILIKPSAGGGGKGMRVVERTEEFADALSGARREAKASFGDDRVLLEKYLTRPRHIELQVFADTHGNVVHLFERDCSVQRRHQKIIEEAPAPGMTSTRRARMGAAAVAAARAIGYVGAGTVEFIVPAESQGEDSFYFMEMNTRLQVEHPVTEMITGLDLVEWQLRVAAGERLPLTQDEIRFEGHAIEARIYAEDPDRDFLPSVGRIAHLQTPVTPDVRIDTGVRAGDEITRYYDPMIAKLIVRGDDRDAALRRLTDALAACQIVGVASNIAFLQRVVTHEAFAQGKIDTGLIAAHRDALLPPAAAPSERALAVAALGELQRLRDLARLRSARSPDRWSPWGAIDTWWLNADDHAIAFDFAAGEATFTVKLRVDATRVGVTLGARTFDGEVERAGDELRVRLDDTSFPVTVVALGKERYVFCDSAMTRLVVVDPLAHPEDDAPEGGHLMAPMSGTVVVVLVEQGQSVDRGAPLMILEAMKMEHTISAPAAGKVTTINYRAGEQVAEGADLLDIESAAAE